MKVLSLNQLMFPPFQERSGRSIIPTMTLKWHLRHSQCPITQVIALQRWSYPVWSITASATTIIWEAASSSKVRWLPSFKADARNISNSRTTTGESMTLTLPNAKYSKASIDIQSYSNSSTELPSSRLDSSRKPWSQLIKSRFKRYFRPTSWRR